MTIKKAKFEGKIKMYNGQVIGVLDSGDSLFFNCNVADAQVMRGAEVEYESFTKDGATKHKLVSIQLPS